MLSSSNEAYLKTRYESSTDENLDHLRNVLVYYDLIFSY